MSPSAGTNTWFDTLLIANRGEIACRIIRAARSMGLRTIAVHSAVDREALHVSMADASVPLPHDAPLHGYLSGEAVLSACRMSGAGAVHPGYGFLAEDAAFARACEAAGIVFVGPPAAAIEQLGDKARAKQLAEGMGIPCLPGYGGADQSAGALAHEAARIGAPLMIKAAFGGGGRGMRQVDDLALFPTLAEAARNEASAAFGDGTLLLEKLAAGARHVEIQVVADRHGACVHLGERDCSTQRRHQKIIEEAPAPGISPATRDAMGDAAVRLLQAAGYIGAGTVEFLMMPDGSFRFLEVNPRLQVEHPVTEAVTGIDLVEMQLRIARGEPLGLAQPGLRFDGHAIEARLCAEDAARGFAPQSGPILAWRVPQAPHLRIDHALSAGASVSPHFDSLIAKIIAHGRDRDEARRRLIAALDEVSVLGVKTNRAFLQSCLLDRAFTDARLNTDWLATASFRRPARAPVHEWRAAATAFWAHSHARAHGVLANWSSNGRRTMHASLGMEDDERWTATVTAAGDAYRVRIHARDPAARPVDGIGSGAADADAADAGEIHVRFACSGRAEAAQAIWIGGRRRPFHACCQPGPQRTFRAWVDVAGLSAGFFDAAALPPARAHDAASADVRAGMHGQLTSLLVSVGEIVQAGQHLLSIEAMKMEHRIAAPAAGRIAEVGARIGTQVSPATLLVRIEPQHPATGPGISGRNRS